MADTITIPIQGTPIRATFPIGTDQEVMKKAMQKAYTDWKESQDKEGYLSASQITTSEKYEEDVAAQDIIRHESVKTKKGEHIVFPDVSGDGTFVAGHGHQLSKEEENQYPKGATVDSDKVKQWFDADLRIAKKIALRLHPKATGEVFNILTNMAYNMGEKRLKGFKGMFKALEAGDFQRAGEEMLWKDPDAKKRVKTPYHKQTKTRAIELAKRMSSLSFTEEDSLAEDTKDSIRQQNLTIVPDGLHQDEEGNLFTVKGGVVEEFHG